MATIPEQSVAALFGLISGLVGGYVPGRRQAKRDRAKEARLPVVAAMSGQYYSQLEPLAHKTFALDVDLANAGTRYLESPEDGLKTLSELHEPIETFSSEFNGKVADSLEAKRR